MHVTSLTQDHWVGTHDHGSTRVNPSWSDIEAAIKNLNGQDRTLVILRARGDEHLSVGGGSGRYVVYLTRNNRNFSTVCMPDKAGTMIPVVTGGQEGEYPSDIVVDVSSALKAAKRFSETGKLDDELHWHHR